MKSASNGDFEQILIFGTAENLSGHVLLTSSGSLMITGRMT
jgi:hypothetical protein